MQIEDIKVGTCFTMPDPYFVNIGGYFKVVAFTKTGILAECYDGNNKFLNEHILTLIPENVKNWELRKPKSITYYINVYANTAAGRKDGGIYTSVPRTDFQSTKNAAKDYNTTYLYTIKHVEGKGTIFNILD